MLQQQRLYVTNQDIPMQAVIHPTHKCPIYHYIPVKPFKILKGGKDIQRVCKWDIHYILSHVCRLFKKIPCI